MELLPRHEPAAMADLFLCEETPIAQGARAHLSPHRRPRLLLRIGAVIPELPERVIRSRVLCARNVISHCAYEGKLDVVSNRTHTLFTGDLKPSYVE
jgi:hypothetical protein